MQVDYSVPSSPSSKFVINELKTMSVQYKNNKDFKGLLANIIAFKNKDVVEFLNNIFFEIKITSKDLPFIRHAAINIFKNI